MNFKTNLAYADWDFKKEHKNNVVAFARRKGHGIVEANMGDEKMKNLKKSGYDKP